jgi:DNA-binding transcriptional MerR regulator
MQAPLTNATVARRLGVSEATVRRMDAVLQPIRDSAGRRLYDPEVVERVAAERAART